MWSGSFSTWCCTFFRLAWPTHRSGRGTTRPSPRRALGGLLLVSLLAACAPYQFRGAAFNPAVRAPDFTLTDNQNRPFRLSDLQGGVVLLTFGYTSCPDVCPATLATVKQALREVEAEGEPVTLLFVTVDPLRDTPETMTTFLGKFSPEFVGLTGDPADLAEVMAAYGIETNAASLLRPGSNGTVDHTGRLYLIDAQGMLRTQYPVGATDEDLTQDLRHVLDQG